MENQHQNKNQRMFDDKSGKPDSSDNTTSQSSEVKTSPDGTAWPQDETLEEFLEKEKSNSKMKPGQLDKH